MLGLGGHIGVPLEDVLLLVIYWLELLWTTLSKGVLVVWKASFHLLHRCWCWISLTYEDFGLMYSIQHLTSQDLIHKN